MEGDSREEVIRKRLAKIRLAVMPGPVFWRRLLGRGIGWLVPSFAPDPTGNCECCGYWTADADGEIFMVELSGLRTVGEKEGVLLCAECLTVLTNTDRHQSDVFYERRREARQILAALPVRPIGKRRRF